MALTNTSVPYFVTRWLKLSIKLVCLGVDSWNEGQLQTGKSASAQRHNNSDELLYDITQL